MRRSFGKAIKPSYWTHEQKALFLSSPFDYSTSSDNGGSGGGRGRGRGSDFPKFSFVDSGPGKSKPTSPGEEASFPPPLGLGRGKPLPPPPNIPQFTSFGAPGGNRGTVTGGRGVVPPPQSEESSKSRTRISFRKEGEAILPPKAPTQGQSGNQEKSTLPPTILSVLSGAGRGQPT